MSRFLTKILNDRPGELKAKLEVAPNINQTQTITQPKPDAEPTQTKPLPLPVQTQTKARPKPEKAIAPENDFNKRANILERDALPNGLFPGASKAIYDALYLRTLGSINPKKRVQATRKELMKWSGVKNIKTINTHLRKLKDSGLIVVTNFTGEQTGSYYEVLLPKPGDPDQTQSTQTEGKPDAYQKMDSDPDQKTVWVGSGKDTENKDTYGFPKTSLKTNTKNDDDEADALFSGFIEKFQTAAKKLTGAPLSKYECEKWERLADLLVLELETASRHASNPVSSVPAFLTKVLSSKLLNQKPAERMSKPKSGAKPDTVGKYYPELDGSDDEIKPLDNESRQAALDLIREFKDDKEFLDSYRKWYTEEDWKWLLKELEIND
jgi:hypothetical protein